MAPVLHDSDEWKQLLADVRLLEKGQHNLELQMVNLIGSDGDGGILGTMVSAVTKLDITVSSLSETVGGWKAVLEDRKVREDRDWKSRKLWFPIIAALLTGLLLMLVSMWLTRSGKQALVGTFGTQVLADRQNAGMPLIVQHPQ